MKLIQLGPSNSVDDMLKRHDAWVRELPHIEQDRLKKEMADLFENGIMVFNQGGSMNSKRTLSLGGQSITIHANFRHTSAFGKLLRRFGWR
jgi:hypothetical protein